MKLKATKKFSWAHRGVEIKEYAAGEIIDTDDADLIRVAKAEGWAKSAGKDDGGTADGKSNDGGAGDGKANDGDAGNT